MQSRTYHSEGLDNAGFLDTHTISEPQPTAEVLRRLDLKQDSLVVLAMPSEGGGEGSSSSGGGLRYPVCKIINKAQEREVQRCG